MLEIYCGDGKGKTTAAVGLAVRAAGAGLRVLFCQFLKNGSSSEIGILESISSITLSCCKECTTFTSKLTETEKLNVTERHNSQLAEALDSALHGKYDVIVLDEFLDAYNKKLLDRKLAEKLVRECCAESEMILTGRDPAQIFLGCADYISEIKAVRHPYSKGIAARRGIEF